MLASSITLSTDKANNGTIVPEVFTRYDEFQNRSEYNGPANTLLTRDKLTCYRSPVKRSGNFNGVAKTSVKISKTFVVAGYDTTTSVAAPAIAEGSFSFPVGMSSAEMEWMRQRLMAAIDHAFCKALTESLEI